MANKLYSYPDEEEAFEFETLEELLNIESVKYYSQNPFSHSVKYTIHETFEFEEWYPPYDYMLMVEVTASTSEGNKIIEYAIGRLKNDIPEFPRVIYPKWIKMWIDMWDNSGGQWHFGAEMAKLTKRRPVFRSELNKMVDDLIDSERRRIKRIKRRMKSGAN